MKWRETTLGDISVGGRGSYGIAAPAVPRSSELFTYLRITDIQDDGSLNKVGLQSVEVEDVGKYLLHPNDIVFARTGASTGRSYFYDGTDGELVYAGFLIKFSLDPNKVFPEYVKYYCLSDKYRAWVVGHSVGSTRGNCNASDFASMPILLPPFPIQQKIADVLGAYDDLIENNRRRIELLEKMARELYRERFVRRREGVFETRTLEQIGVRLESGSRPKGGVKDLDEGIPSVGAENVIGLGKYNYGSEKLISEDFYTKMRRGKIQDRDILLYKDGAYIGRVSLFQDGFPHKVAAVNEHVFLLHAEDEVIQYYLFFTLAQEKYFKIMQGLNENAAQPGLNQGSVYGLKIDMPDFEQIKQFNDFVSPLVSEIFSLSNQNRNLAKQRDRLLPRLMSGKLDVSKLVKEGV